VIQATETVADSVMANIWDWLLVPSG